MNLSRFSIMRPVFTVMVMLIIVILGSVSLTRVPIDLMPDITYPVISISTAYENAGPEEVEELITRPIEQAMVAVPGVEEVTSSSTEGASNVRVSFTWGTDLNEASNDIRDRLDRIIGRLPDDADRPLLRKFDLAAFPILIMGASSRMDPVQLRRLIEDQIAYRIERVPGVASLTVWGGLNREIWVEIEPARLRALDLSLDRITSVIRESNVTLPAGSIERGDHDLVIRTPGTYADLDELRDTVIDSRGGSLIRLRDIATVTDRWERQRRIVRVNGEPGVMVAINKQSGVNTVNVARRVQREIQRINEDIPYLTLTPIVDSSEYIERSIRNVSATALYGGLFAVIVLLFFLRNIRSTLIIASAIPVSIVATFTLIYFSGFTLNLMTLGGLALGIGMLVDNAIVVLENIYRQRESGLPRRESAIRGSSEVIAAIIASTLTTLVVFLPMIFTRGMAGILFRQLAFVVGFALIASLVVALTLVPMLCSRFLRTGEGTWAGRLLAFSEAGFLRLETRYRDLLGWALNHRLIVLGVVALIFAISLTQIPHIGSEFMPATDEGEVRVNVEADAGTRLAVMDRLFQQIEAITVATVPERENMIANFGGGTWRGGGGHTGVLRLSLTPLRERTRSSDEVAAALRRDLASIPGATIRVRTTQGIAMRGMGAGEERLQIEIRGYDFETADALAQRVLAAVTPVAGITDALLSRDAGTPEVAVRVDRLRAADLRVSVAQVARSLQTILGGTRTGVYRELGQEVAIRVRVRDAETLSLDEILDLTLTNVRGDAVALRNLVRLEDRTGPVQIERKDQERIVTVSANTSDRDMGSIIRDVRQALMEVPIPEGFAITFGGDYEEQQESFRELTLGLILALILVYMVMACLYESLRGPLVVMFSIPLAAIGVIWMLRLTETTFNVQSFVGCIMLGGIVVNNAILLVDHINLLRRRDNLTRSDAIREAGRRRLRPILMTATTTMCALIPMALGLGEGGEAQAPLARVVVGGLASASLITLLIVPVMYALIAPRIVSETQQPSRGASRGAVGIFILLLSAGLAQGDSTRLSLQLSLDQAVLSGLENNPSLQIERLTPDIRQVREDRERARFDTGISADVSHSQESTAARLPGEREVAVDRSEARLDVGHQLSSGTRIGIDALIRQDDPDEASSLHTVRVGVSVTQALLQGAGRTVNRVGIRQAELDTRASRHELLGYTKALVARIETAYWELELAARRLDIVRESAQLAARQLDDVEQRIAAGTLASTEGAAARAEVALRNGALINAGSDYDQARLRLLHLIRPAETAWETTVDLTTPLPDPPSVIDPVSEHVALASLMRSDLNAARLAWERGDLEVVRTRNGVLPRLDIFVRLGQTAYAGSFGDAVSAWGDNTDYSAGIQLAYDVGRRAARANQRESYQLRDQAELAILNLANLAALDVYSAHTEVQRADEQVKAATLTHAAQAEKYRAEMEKFDVGRSTALLVAQAQRDVMNAQLAETEARIRALTARIALSRADGSLLLRRGIGTVD